MKTQNAYINAIEYYLPLKEISNADISGINPAWSGESILAKIGIEKRYVCGEDEFVSDLAYNAAELLFAKNTQIKREHVDYILLCTQTPDFQIPTTACYLQNKLGLRKDVGAMDFNLGCSGFVYGLSMARALIESRQASNILLITAETYSKHIHPNDYKNKALFGDAAAATFVSNDPVKGWLNGVIQNFEFGTDGSGYDKLIHFNSSVTSNAKKEKFSMVYDESAFGDEYLFMDGKYIFDFTLTSIPGLIKRTLEKNSVLLEDVDVFIMHQANQFMLDAIRKRAKIPVEKFFISMKDKGNTVSSTIPIAICDAIQQNKIAAGNRVLLAGFGVGLSMSGCLLQY